MDIARRQFLRGDFTARRSLLRPVIADGCLAHRAVVCRSCGDACTTRAIRFGLAAGAVAFPYLLPEACTGCGRCAEVCPVSAVTLSGPARTVAA